MNFFKISNSKLLISFCILFYQSVSAQYKLYVFVYPDCPICKYYLPQLNSLAADTNYQSVEFNYYIPLKNVSKKRIKSYLEKMSELILNRNEKIIVDKKNKMAQKLNAKVTPHVFLFNEYNICVYEGLIDDKYEGIGRYKQNVRQFYLIDALNSLIKNTTPPISKTEPIGCIIEY